MRGGDASIYLSIYPSICLSVYLSIHLSIYLSIYPSIYLSICLLLHLHIWEPLTLILTLSQGELEEKMREEAMQRLRNGGDGAGDDGASQDTPIAYRDPGQFPSASSSGSTLRTNQTFVDQKQEG